MQGFFSMFPTGRAGVALLFLRVSVAATLLFGVITGPYTLPLKLASAVISIALCLGIATPVCAAICCIAEVVLLLNSSGATAVCLALAALISLTLALLGPGGYSLDARSFGRRRIVFTNRKDGGDDG
jgi:hypothetical protein